MALPLLPAPDLLLSDVSLPGVGGPALAQLLRARWPRLKVTLMTGYLDAKTRELSRGEGWEVLQKPFEMEELRSHLANALGEAATVPS
jgi:DNA-binding NtrC family response regulator